MFLEIALSDMNKKLKFRVWDNEMGQWMVERSDFEQVIKLGYPCKEKQCYIRLTNTMGWTVQQFTGLMDKDDKEIYEGDILEENLGHGDIVFYKVEYYQDGFWLIAIIDITADQFNDKDWDVKKAFELEPEEQPRMASFYYGMKVVGNIFENPELLK